MTTRRNAATPMATTRMAIIRHGPTHWNANRRMQGRTDVPLSDSGRRAVETWRVPDEYVAFEWVCSPLARALETARILGAPASPPTDERLSEIDWGAWEGRTMAEVRIEIGAPELQRRVALGLDFKAPGGECPRDLQARLTPWLRDVAASGRATLAIAHQGVIRALVALATGWNHIHPPPTPIHIRAVAHEFAVAADGGLKVTRLNVPLGDAAAME